MKCPFCKEEIHDEALKCRYCGSMLTSEVVQVAENRSGPDFVTADEIRAFAGNNAEYYIYQASKFNKSGTEKFCPTWNWSAFGFTFMWMLYRKMYFQAVITFVVFCMPGINILLHIAIGVLANYLYYIHLKEKITSVRTIHSGGDFHSALRLSGGTHSWVIWAGVVFTIIMGIAFYFLFAAISTHIENPGRLTI